MTHRIVLVAFCALVPALAPFNQATATPIFNAVAEQTATELATQFSIKPNANIVAINPINAATSMQAGSITVPLPNGETATFELALSSVMPQALRDKFPGINAYVGTSAEEGVGVGRFELGPNGFYGMFNYKGDTVFIDPVDKANALYQSYFKSDAFTSGIKESPLALQRYNYLKQRRGNSKSTNNSSSITYDGDAVTTRQLRIAVSASGEYTQFHGGTAANGLAAVVTAVNRVTQVYQQDFGVTFQLVDNNDTVIYTDPNSDPYVNDSDSDITNVVATLKDRIGDDNFDIGHLFNTSESGGYAPGSVCSNEDSGDSVSGHKAAGLSGLPSPVGDAFDVDFVGHELGHQFGANHTFNSCDGNSGSRVESNAYEVGSGVTIMSYLGSCTTTNLKESPGYPYFHSSSVDEIKTRLGQISCGTTGTDNNTTPTVSVTSPTGLTIPINTPFELTGSATDTEGDTISYSWEQYDLGSEAADSDALGDDGNRSIFRNWELTSSGTRAFPRLEDVIDGSLTMGENYPTTTRELNFRLVARDSRGGVSHIAYQLNTSNSAGPFTVTSPASGASLQGGEATTVTWNVANTDQSPVNCSNVSISYLSSSTATPSTLLASTENDGSASVTLPTSAASAAHLKVACADNVFYAMSPAVIVSEGSSSPSGSARPLYDFDNDSKADMLYRSTSDLSWRMDLMNGATVTESLPGNGMSTCCGWLFNGVGDFNADGYDDVLVRNVSSGRWYIYNLNKNVQVSRGYADIQDAIVMAVQAVADFNGDGYSDVLLRNVETGEWNLSLLNTRTVQQIIEPPMSRVLGWQIVDAKDFDANGSPDILIRNSTSGAWYIYLYTGTDITTRGYLTSLTSDVAEVIQAVADFDGDGKADVLVRNSSTQVWSMIKMDGLSSETMLTMPLTTDAAWTFNAADDYNGDGYADVSLVNRTTSAVYVYSMNGTTILSEGTTNESLPSDMEASDLRD